MKNRFYVLAILALTGCASTNYSELELATATVRNIEVTEIGNPLTNEHKLDLKFDYKIDGYHEVPRLYTCSILFTLKDDKVMHTVLRERNPCSLDSQTGTVSITWDTPLSTSAGYSQETLEQMTLPLKYHVAIHQKQSNRSNVIIGLSNAMYLHPEM